MLLILGLMLLAAAALVWFFMRDRDMAAPLAGGLVITAGILVMLPYLTKGVVIGSLALHETAIPDADDPEPQP